MLIGPHSSLYLSNVAAEPFDRIITWAPTRHLRALEPGVVPALGPQGLCEAPFQLFQLPNILKSAVRPIPYPLHFH